MYCGSCSNVLFRKSDEGALYAIWPSIGDAVPVTLRFYEDMERNAPPCPCGGHFKLWSNVKCPSCKFEIPYNNGVKDVNVRINDHVVVLVEGALLLGDDTITKE